MFFIGMVCRGAGADTIFQLFFPNQDITAIHYIVAVQHALDMGILPFVAMGTCDSTAIATLCSILDAQD